MNNSRAVLLIGVDVKAVQQALQRLEPNKQNKVLKQALKITAEQARNRLAEKARGTYTVKNAGFKRAMKIQMLSSSAAIRAEGQPLQLKEFKVSKAGKTVRAQVLKSGHLKELKRGGIKAFVNNIARKGQTRRRSSTKGKQGSGVRHIAVAQRTGKDRLKINEKFSNSIPAMIGNQRNVYGVVEPYIEADLRENLKKFIDQTLEGAR